MKSLGFAGLLIRGLKSCCLFSFCTLLFFSCTPPGENATHQNNYFNISSFFDQQITEINKDSLVAIKTSAINGVSDMHQMPWTDWKKEFALFYASDINKPAFSGKYTVDTIATSPDDSSAFMISYKANDEDLRTRLMEVSIDKKTKSVKSVHIRNHASNFFASSDEELFYETLKGYIMKSTDQKKLFGESDFAVKGELVNKNNHFIESVNQ